MATQLTPAQLATLKAAINGNPTWAAYPTSGDGYIDLAALLNTEATPAVKAWRFIPKADVLKVMDPAEIDNLFTASKGNALNFSLNHINGIDCTTASGPRAITDLVSNTNPQAPNSRSALLNAGTQNITQGQQIFGGGSVASATPPVAITAVLRNFTGTLTAGDIEAARNS